ncbi:MAG: hypothetical protein H6719_38320 [Sandaracinaceae bacterium]|nr:hypothetical protein [Sandaracinaceae bacterium]
MSHEKGAEDDIFARLHELDLELLVAVQRRGCRDCCGGRLDRADFSRKVRGVSESAERYFETRFALCCSREGCRRRTLPPSLRFLGRRVFAAVAIVAACVAEQAHRRWQEARRIRRWLAWWREDFGGGPRLLELRGRLAVPIDRDALPGSLLAAVQGPTPADRLVRLLALVADVVAPIPHEG